MRRRDAVFPRTDGGDVGGLGGGGRGRGRGRRPEEAAESARRVGSQKHLLRNTTGGLSEKNK